MAQRLRMPIDGLKRFLVMDYGEDAWPQMETATEVWNLVSPWEVGRETIYDNGRIITRQQLRAEIERERHEP